MQERITAESCLTCGVCCLPTQYQDCFCDVSEEDLKRLGKRSRGRFVRPSLFSNLLLMFGGRRCVSAIIKTRIREIRSGPLKGKEVCACTFLSGSPMKQVKCLVYKSRPDTCREAVVPGDKTCRKLRKFWKGIIQTQCKGVKR